MTRTLKTKEPRTLIWDVEVTPWLGLMYGSSYEPKTVKILEYQRILCFAYKWIGDKDVTVIWAGLRSDKKAAIQLRSLLNKADIVMAYNGKRFDTKQATTRFEYHKIPQPSPFEQIDPLLVARKKLLLPSNKMDEVARFYKIEGKHETKAGLWHRCMQGDPVARKEMAAYNIQDVLVLEGIYNKSRHLDDAHPNMNHWSFTGVCRVCSSDKLVKDGIRRSKLYVRQVWRCKEQKPDGTVCGTNTSERIGKKKPVLK